MEGGRGYGKDTDRMGARRFWNFSSSVYLDITEVNAANEIDIMIMMMMIPSQT